MRISIFLIALICTLFSCKKQSENSTKTAATVGNRNEIIIVIDDSLWNGNTGDSIRQHLIKREDIILVKEPLFDVIQYSPKIFNNEAKKYRNIIDFTINAKDTFSFKKNKFSTPQNYFTISGKSSSELIKLLQKNSDSISNTIKNMELTEEQAYFSTMALHEDDLFNKLFGTTLRVPMYYRIAMKTDDPFLWFQKPLSSGDVNLVLFEFPISYIENNPDNIAQNIINAQDSIGKHYLKGAKSFSYFLTDKNKPVQIQWAMHKDIPVYKIRGHWKMENDFIYGPYIAYVYKDEYYNRYLFIVGFINDPNKPKRNQLTELEAIFQSIDFYENNV